MLRRLAAAAVAAALTVSLAAMLAGCGSDAGQAQGMMEAADGKMMANWKAVGQVSSSTDELSAWLTGALSSGSGIDQGGFDESVDELRGQVSDIQSEYGVAAQDYQDILDMEAPQGYHAYARLKIREIAVSDALLNELDGFLIRTSERMSKTGLEPAWFASEVAAYRAKYDELYRKAVDLGLRARAVQEQSAFGKQGPLPDSSPVSP